MKIVYRYAVMTGKGEVIVEADRWDSSDQGLIFYYEEVTVAWFRDWLHWIVMGRVDK